MQANLLRAKIVESGFTQAQVAKGIGISSNSLTRKLTGVREFKLSEIVKLCSFLNIDNPKEIFYQKNPKKATKYNCSINYLKIKAPHK